MDNYTTSEKKKEGFLGQQMIVLPPDSLKEIVNNSLIQNLYFTAIGFYPHAEYHDRKREFGSDEYILLYCTEGEGKVRVENHKFKLKPNHFIIIPPQAAHHYKSSIENPWSIYWVDFTGKNASIIYDRYLQERKSAVNFLAYEEQRVKIFMEIIQLLEYSFDKKSLEFANINHLYFLSSFAYEPKLISKKSIVDNSIDFMKKNLQNSFRIEDFAARENLSVSRFSEVFKEKTGYSPIHYFIRLKYKNRVSTCTLQI